MSRFSTLKRGGTRIMRGIKPLFINDLGSSSLATFRQDSSRLSHRDQVGGRRLLARLFLWEHHPTFGDRVRKHLCNPARCVLRDDHESLICKPNIF